ncbi:MAG: SDR family oxidoreductase [Pseudomonadota bacterium]
MATKIKHDRDTKICVITGATSGIGRAAALKLAGISAQLILLSRNASKGRGIADRINSSSGFEKALFIQTDLSRLSEVRTAAEQIKNRCRRIDVLINNAGARFNDFKKNDDGIELTFATNHLGHFLLTLLLIDHMKASPGGRIINVASDVHRGYTADFDYVHGAGSYDRKAAYGQSKLANLLFTYELARRLADTNITVNALHPGGVATNLGRNNGLKSWLKHYVYYLMKRQLISPSKAAETILYLALSDEVQGVTGKYFAGKKEISSSDVSCDRDAQKKLWDLSDKLCSI